MTVLSANPTTQEVYEHIRAYFSQPGAELAKEDKSCLYRTEDGRKCAVGCCIPDEVYDSYIGDDDDPDFGTTIGNSIEGTSVDEIVYIPVLRKLLNGSSEEGRRKLHFLEEAQKAHDQRSGDAADFVALLDDLAHDFKLKPVS